MQKVFGHDIHIQGHGNIPFLKMHLPKMLIGKHSSATQLKGLLMQPGFLDGEIIVIMEREWPEIFLCIFFQVYILLQTP